MIINFLLAGILVSGLLILIFTTFLVWNKPVLIIYIQLGFCYFSRFLVFQIGFPEPLKYFSDYLTMILLLQIILHFNKTKYLNIRKPLLFFILYAAVAVVSTIYNRSNLLFFFWGMRLNFRFFIFFFACVIFLRRTDIDKLLKFQLYLLPVNTVIILFQYFVQGLRFDFLGGLFGNQESCNSELNLYMFLITAVSIVFYTVKKINLPLLIINIGMVSLTAALSELKILYVIIPFVVLIVFIYYFPNVRILRAGLFIALLLIVSFSLLVTIYPHWRVQLSNIDDIILNTAKTEYTHAFSLSRMTAGPYLFQNVLTTPSQKLLGIGFGSAGNFLSFESPFFIRYSMLNYDIFHYAYILAEIGIIGLIAYCLFFMSISYESIRIKRILNLEFDFYCCISFIISLLVLVFIVYHPSMYMDGAFIFYFHLTFPFIIERDLNEGNLILKGTVEN